jgi:hypothetical protein
MVLDLVVVIIDAGVSTLGLLEQIRAIATDASVGIATVGRGQRRELVGESGSATAVAGDLEPIGIEGTALQGRSSSDQTCRNGATE